MDATKIGLGAFLLATSGATLEATGISGSSVPLGLSALALVALVAYGLLEARVRDLPR